jgi:hypothetical protein
MEPVLGQQAQVGTDWEALLAAARAGGVDPCVRLQECLTPGIRLLLARKPLRIEADVALAQVLASVVDAVRTGRVGCVSELAGVARAAITEHVAPRRPVAQATFAANPTTVLDTHLSARQRDMLRRFYVLGQEPADICRGMGVTMEEFTRAKSLARAAVAVSVISSRQSGRGVRATA